MNNIFYKQRTVAEDRAFDHQFKYGKNQCLAYDVDPMPELPLDSVQWGNSACLNLPVSHYKQTFQNPQVLAQERKADVERFKNAHE